MMLGAPDSSARPAPQPLVAALVAESPRGSPPRAAAAPLAGGASPQFPPWRVDQG
jgi:hypothetical protein